MNKLVFGKAKSGKTEYVLNDLLKSRAERRLFVVPDQFALSAERLVAERSGRPGLIDVEVVSLTRLAQRVAAEQGIGGEIPITAVGRSILLREVLLRIRSRLLVFGQNADKPGFLRNLSDTLETIDIREIPRLEGNDLAARKLHDLALIRTAYEQRKSVYLDDAGNLDRAIACIPSSGLIAQSAVWIDDYDHFSERELRMIAAISRRAQDLTVSICADESSNFTRYTRRSIRALRRAAEWTEIEMIAGPRSGLQALAENVFRYEDIPTEADGLELFAADDRYAEVSYLAARITGLARDRGIAFQRIGVLCPNLGAYESTIRRVFNRCELPYFIDSRASIAHNPLTVFLRSLMDFYLSPGRIDGIVGMVKSSALTISRYSAADYEIRCIEQGILPYNLASKTVGEEARAVHDLLIDLTGRFERDERCTTAEFARRISAILRDFDIAANLEKSIRASSVLEHEGGQGERVEAGAHRQIWDRVIGVLEEMAQIDSGEPMSLYELDRLLSAAISGIDAGRIPATDNAVTIGGIDRARDRRLDALFVLGALDGAFPVVKPAGGLFTAREKERIARGGIDDFLDEIDVQRENFRIYFALSRPEKYLFLSYPLTTGEGGASRSLLINKIERITGVRAVTAARLEETEAFSVSSPRQTLEIAAAAPTAATRRADEILARRIPGLYASLMSGADYTGALSEDLRIRGAGSGAYSVSALERYGECPFRFFVERTLLPRSIREYRIEADRFGSAVHAVLEKLIAELYPENPPAGREEAVRAALGAALEPLVDRVVSQTIQDPVYFSTSENRFILYKLKQSVLSSLESIRLQIAKGDFYPAHCELNYRYPVPGTDYVLRGIIDRVDEDDRHFRVIDYKTGKRAIDVSKIYDGTELQLMTYALVYAEMSGKPCAGMYYFLTGTERHGEKAKDASPRVKTLTGISLFDPEALRAQGIDGSPESPVSMRFKNDGEPYANSPVLTRREWEKLSDIHRGNLTRRIRRIDEGEIPIAPRKQGEFTACRFCEYGAICQFDATLPRMSYREIAATASEDVLRALREEESR